MRRHVVLVGLPGSGKSTVGRLVADALGAAFEDVDDAIVRRDGRPVRRIFEEDGEGAFRALELVVGREVLALSPRVIATGGGFLQAAELSQLALRSGLVVYLETSPGEAARRLAGQEPRPLLVGVDVARRLAQLLEQRRVVYHQAPQRVMTDGIGPAAVAELVVELARREGGW